ncbi:uncharacterized protein LOC107266469 isoform X2 [Cephus cinctus]|uniref:Uncharacterized protein LOC107266469 isoform X2 n=1 Tax=Cephus cinctus TaxID=211228 RepID=A0AAJ7REK4_CEPCN|nr:uncharacterized protein LOC107266469 isoform X2 [Cephus cinctus]
MPDDPNRDIFTVKEGSYIDTCRSDIDSRERHFVCKLDRYQLEDRYLRLLDEIQGLKKLSNSQEDKIKRLATKLMRVSANPRLCATALDIVNDKDRISSLELENKKLKDKICVLKSQLLSQKALGRSPSRCRRVQTRTSSGPTTCRSENGRVKTPSCQSIMRNGSDDNDTQNYLVKIEELEMQKKEMASRITYLEDELSIHLTGNQREKVAENVEYIRLWRQLKQLNDKLIGTQNLNDDLNTQINDLKKVLEETTKDNREITSALVTEKERMVEMHEQMTKAKDSQLSLREKDEQIRDLMNEMKILQQHNSELIALSSKYTQVEIENVELKKRISEQLFNHQSLKSAFNNEQANIAALQAANEQLLTKLQELQKNMDSLTIQLKNQNERHVRATTSVQTSSKNLNNRVNDQSSTMEDRSGTLDNSYSSKSECCRKCCEEFQKKVVCLETSTNHAISLPLKKNTDKGVQTQFENTTSNATAPDTQIKSPVRTSDKQQPPNSLSREKMLKLLEQAQINTPLEAQNAARIRQIDATCSTNFSGISETVQRQSYTQNKKNTYINEKSTKIGLDNMSRNTQNANLSEPNEILKIFYEILGEYKKKCSKYDDNNIFVQEQCECNNEQFYNQYVDHCEVQGTDQFNDHVNHCPNMYDEHRTNLTVYDKLREIGRPKITNTGEDNKTNKNLHKFKETECTCTHNQKCIMDIDSNYKCCPSCSSEHLDSYEKESTSLCCKMNSRPFNNAVRNIAPEIQKMFDTMYMSRRRKNSMKYDAQNNAQSYPTENSKNCGNCMMYKTDSFPMLITAGQGLIEVHVLYLQLSTAATQALSLIYNLSDICLFVSWNIWGQEKAFTPIMKYPKLNFNSSSVYRISEMFPFFDYILNDSIIFQINVVNKNDDALTIGEAKLCVKNILDYPQNKMHYIANVLSNLSCNLGMDFGQLSLWVRLSCDMDTVDAFKDQKGLLSQSANIPTSVTDPKIEEETKQNHLTNSTSLIYIKEEPTILNIPAKSGPVKKEDSPLESYLSISANQMEPHSSLSHDKTTMEDEYDTTPNESREKSKIIRNVNLVSTIPKNPVSLPPKVTKADEVEQIETSSIVEFNNVLKNNPGPYLKRTNSALRDLSAVFEETNWDRYRKSFIASNTQTKDNDKYYDDGDIEDSDDFINNTEDTITIEIVSMTLFKTANLYKSTDVKLLYVEYSFLGHYGADMETISVLKPLIDNGKMFYNFKRKFEIDEKAHSFQREMLRAMLSEAANPNIRFVIVSEPLPEEMDTKECVDVGYANFNIKEYAMGDGFKEVPLVIMNTRQTEQIGLLKIAIDGIQVIQRCLAEVLGK